MTIPTIGKLDVNDSRLFTQALELSNDDLLIILDKSFGELFISRQGHIIEDITASIIRPHYPDFMDNVQQTIAQNRPQLQRNYGIATAIREGDRTLTIKILNIDNKGWHIVLIDETFQRLKQAMDTARMYNMAPKETMTYILQQIGFSYQEIASASYVHTETVKMNRRRAIHKLSKPATPIAFTPTVSIMQSERVQQLINNNSSTGGSVDSPEHSTYPHPPTDPGFVATTDFGVLPY